MNYDDSAGRLGSPFTVKQQVGAYPEKLGCGKHDRESRQESCQASSVSCLSLSVLGNKRLPCKEKRKN